MISLHDLLESRDKRAEMQKDLLGKYPGKSLLCLTVLLPGSEKRNARSLVVARAAVEAIRERFSPDEVLLRDLETGYEGFFVVRDNALEAKGKAVEIEDSHPLGRLMDIDVITPDGPLGRHELGLGPRPCLICGKPARVCMRARTHTQEQLLEVIGDKVDKFLLSSQSCRSDV